MKDKFNRFMNRPYLSAFIMIIVLFSFRLLINIAAVPLLQMIKDPVIAISLAYSIMTVLFLIIWTVYLRMRKSYLPKSGLGKRGGLKKNWWRILLMMLPSVIYAFLVAGIKMEAYNVDMSWDPQWFMYAASMSLSAGVVEEIICRGIPVGNGMRNIKNKTQMIRLVAVTSLVFGVMHLINLLDGAPLDGTISQIIHAAGYGFFDAALYLRTGSVVPPMIVHAVHDFLSIYTPYNDLIAELTATATAADGFSIAPIVGAIPLALFWIGLAFFMLRKSKWNDIRENFDIAE